MKFCVQCGITLSILDSTSKELCPTCTQKLASTQPKQPEKIQQNTDLLSATLFCKDGKLFLESEEGWLLWSGPDTVSHSLRLMLEKAERILNIRKRQKK